MLKSRNIILKDGLANKANNIYMKFFYIFYYHCLISPIHIFKYLPKLLNISYSFNNNKYKITYNNVLKFFLKLPYSVPTYIHLINNFLLLLHLRGPFMIK